MPEKSPREGRNSSVDKEKETRRGVQTSRNKIFRHRLLFSSLIASCLGAAGYFVFHKENQEHPARGAETRETHEQNQIVLGNVRFLLDEPQKFSSLEKDALFQKMRNAYDKLCEYLRAEVMTSSERVDFKVIYDSKMPDEKSCVTMDVRLKQVNPDGTVLLSGKPKPDYLRINGSEKVIAHEFVHLFAQPSAGVESLAFREGHAHAIEKQLYGTDSNDKDYYHLVQIPEISQMIDRGMDYITTDVVLLGGGAAYDDLGPLIRRKWALAWIELMDKDPLFMQRFYAEIAKLKRNDEINFSKKMYLEIARRVSPYFDEWYKSATSLQEIGSMDSKVVQLALKLSGNRLLIANYQANPRGVLDGKIIPPILEMPVSGKGKIVYVDDSGKPRTYDLPNEHILFEIITLPDNIFRSRKMKIIIGNLEIKVQP